MQEKDNDGQLLQAFAASRDEAAFRLLAQRHLGLVFHTALRRSNGNRAQAEDISQNVLLALARKAAALAKEPERLPGWLHRATLFEASKAMRAESSYQRRKQQSQEEAATAGEIDPAWREALPHLDLALDKLPESDRQVLLLHYFEDHPFHTIAERLGKNAAAVRKQSQRALEKLSRILRTKGVALSVTALAAGLATHTAKAVPEALIHSASSFALSASTSPLAFSLTAMIASKPKVVVPLALLLFGTPLLLQQLAIAREKDQLRSLQQAAAAAPKSTTPEATRRLMPSRYSAISPNLDILVLSNEQMTAQRLGWVEKRDFQAKLAALDQAVLVDLIRKTAAAPLGTQRKSDLSGALTAALAVSNPELAVTTAVDTLGTNPASQRTLDWQELGQHLCKWAQADPTAALEWFHRQEESPKFNAPTLSSSGAPRGLEAMRSPLFLTLATSGATQANDFMSSVPEAERSATIINSLGLLAQRGMHDWLGPYLRITRDFVPEAEREQTLARLAGSAGREGLLKMIGQTDATPAERELFARTIIQGEFNQQGMKHVYQQSGAKPPSLDLDSMTEWLRQIAPGSEQAIIAESQSKVSGESSAAAKKSLDMIRNTPGGLPDQMVAALLSAHDLTGHYPEAIELAERIKDSELKKRTVEQLKARAKSSEAP